MWTVDDCTWKSFGQDIDMHKDIDMRKAWIVQIGTQSMRIIRSKKSIIVAGQCEAVKKTLISTNCSFKYAARSASEFVYLFMCIFSSCHGGNEKWGWQRRVREG